MQSTISFPLLPVQSILARSPPISFLSASLIPSGPPPLIARPFPCGPLARHPLAVAVGPVSARTAAHDDRTTMMRDDAAGGGVGGFQNRTRGETTDPVTKELSHRERHVQPGSIQSFGGSGHSLRLTASEDKLANVSSIDPTTCINGQAINSLAKEEQALKILFLPKYLS
uniref:Uncharacterized protein n=1 Tax=Oryza meridionalis TaxID=40149 RepID=A0A0E0D4B4_9ORYZ